MAQPNSHAFEFRGVTKRFGNTHANQGVSFAVGAGSIHGVVGENGAGKSTIMKVLYGLYQPDEGEILVRGKTEIIGSPEKAISLGIGMVHQHFMLVPTLSVWRNVILGGERSLFGLNERVEVEKLDALQRSFGFSLDLRAEVGTLPVGHQQQVEILKLLYREAGILILDEPTAVLTPQEVEVFFGRLRELQGKGKTIVLISHKLKEILSFTGSVTVMRAGKVVETTETNLLDEDSLAERIVGRKMSELPQRSACRGGAPLLEVKAVRLRTRAYDQGTVSFSIAPGEIVGIAGVEGNGQHELVELLASVTQPSEGEIFFDGKNLATTSTYAIRQQGLGILPSDRHREGVVLDFSVADNLLLGHHREKRFTQGPWLRRKRAAAFFAPLIERFDIRPRKTDLKIAALSGGNQQKVVIARELSTPIRLLIAAHPTRGVDIGAIELIHSAILKLRDEGAGVLLVSSELEEILALSDRILVLFEGRLMGEVTRAKADELELGRWMTGGRT